MLDSRGFYKTLWSTLTNCFLKSKLQHLGALKTYLGSKDVMGEASQVVGFEVAQFSVFLKHIERCKCFGCCFVVVVCGDRVSLSVMVL